MTSKCASAGYVAVLRMSTCWKHTAALLLSALCRAMASASSLKSHAVVVEWGRFSASVTAMQPEPVPMSRMSVCGLPECSSVMMVHSSSVSGRGISTPGST